MKNKSKYLARKYWNEFRYGYCYDTAHYPKIQRTIFNGSFNDFFNRVWKSYYDYPTIYDSGKVYEIDSGYYYSKNKKDLIKFLKEHNFKIKKK